MRISKTAKTGRLARQWLAWAVGEQAARVQQPWPVRFAVQNFDFGVGRNLHQSGLWLDADTDAKQRGKLAGLFGDGDHCRAVIDADDATRLAFKPDDIARAETGRIIHGKFPLD